jgi:hypothetical protein
MQLMRTGEHGRLCARVSACARGWVDGWVEVELERSLSRVGGGSTLSSATVSVSVIFSVLISALSVSMRPIAAVSEVSRVVTRAASSESVVIFA